VLAQVDESVRGVARGREERSERFDVWYFVSL
jgi:hypothetical protein